MDGDVNEETVDSRRGRKRSRRQVPLTALIGAVVATAVLAGGLAGVAVAGLTPSFSDVPPSHPFYDEIEWMAATGVTEGYPDGTFKPGRNVDRGSMSAFMQRLFDLQEDTDVRSSVNFTSTSSTSFVPVASSTVTVDVPPGTSARIVARFSGESVCYAASGFCSIRLMIDTNNDGSFDAEMAPAAGGEYAFDSSDVNSESSSSWEGHAVERWATISRGCTCAVRAEFRVSTGSLVFQVDDYTMVAETDLLPSDESFGP
jgi:hypothetical protein